MLLCFFHWNVIGAGRLDVPMGKAGSPSLQVTRHSLWQIWGGKPAHTILDFIYQYHLNHEPWITLNAQDFLGIFLPGDRSRVQDRSPGVRRNVLYTWSTVKRCKQIALVLFRPIPRIKFPARLSISIGTARMLSTLTVFLLRYGRW